MQLTGKCLDWAAVCRQKQQAHSVNTQLAKQACILHTHHVAFAQKWLIQLQLAGFATLTHLFPVRILPSLSRREQYFAHRWSSPQIPQEVDSFVGHVLHLVFQLLFGWRCAFETCAALEREKQFGYWWHKSITTASLTTSTQTHTHIDR